MYALASGRHTQRMSQRADILSLQATLISGARKRTSLSDSGNISRPHELTDPLAILRDDLLGNHLEPRRTRLALLDLNKHGVVDALSLGVPVRGGIGLATQAKEHEKTGHSHHHQFTPTVSKFETHDASLSSGRLVSIKCNGVSAFVLPCPEILASTMAS